jgi:cystathionine beta-synthase
MESTNPGGSIKDRIGLSMIEAPSARAAQAGRHLVEGTAGNTGIGAGAGRAAEGLPPDPGGAGQDEPREDLQPQGDGREVVLTRSDVAKGHPEYYQDMAARIAAKPRARYFINQFGNPVNPRAHEFGTGPEIWRRWAGRHGRDRVRLSAPAAP